MAPPLRRRFRRDGQRRDDRRGRRDVARVARLVQPANDAGAVDDRDAGELEPVGVAHERAADADLVALLHRLAALAHGIEDDLAPAGAAEAVSAVARLLGIAETREVDAHLRADAASFVGRPLSDRDNLRPASRHRGELTVHLDEMLAADGSTEVAEEQEDRRLLAPEIREADDAAVT